MFFGSLRPRPWALAALLVMTLLGLWFYAVVRRNPALASVEDDGTLA
jgi:hypothetical protein